MRAPAEIDRHELRELLSKCWMTHDAMWFATCVRLCGMETANRINQQAVRSMATIEIRRLQKLLDQPEIRTWQELQGFLDACVELIRCDFMGFEASYPAPGIYRWDMPRCFAFEGISKLGVIDDYQCGIFTRLEGWLDGLGLPYTATPELTGCQMHTTSTCHREYTIQLPNH